MSATSLFSRRQKEQKNTSNKALIYNHLPEKLRIQVGYIISDAFGKDKMDYYTKIAVRSYNQIIGTLKREYGLLAIGSNKLSPRQNLLDFLLHATKMEEAMDVIELSFHYIDKNIRNDSEYSKLVECIINPDEAITKLNDRFKEHNIGFCYTGGQIIRVDSTVSHIEITQPTITLLQNKKFKNANEEYLQAQDHYRHGRNKECLNECLKAFESVMKIICTEKRWAYNTTDSSKKLIQVCFENDLIPAYLQTQFASLKSLFESGIPTIRNKVGGHGQGVNATKADDELTRYALNLTGANIIFLVEQSGIK